MKWIRKHYQDDKAAARTIFYVGAVGGGVGFVLVLLGTILMKYGA